MNDDPRPWPTRLDLARGFQAIELRHAYIEQDHVGMVTVYLVERFLAVGGLRDENYLRLRGQQGP